ncbi:MAG: tRNA (adenosine(37)-N6)-threonylcarbamoyltransferase complex ATPase subunit type 1 TsaE [Gemmobacter sp.]|uniref:tRNA (adenosine(37)-N6)-threonylcarbamoyltransferase complex ATPase subunit type 1 TsaE n=1 Tax=Gemmobacter sp. TaxID=1898957 RepID=UPI001A44D2EB|nr:tRNA (adenosine(37)-N6)-threonylcarbamoyltransferase complex ATPase subunit type 1 TsaE [Gemmobacter sp.]MBL8561716.1 tRNA (adenosine(37)-N6)-threonylcarbamoyltransferase complex ATPase subunit type 1 TsaE [Gemmobacter sp.]
MITSLFLPDETATDRLACQLAPRLQAGQALLLSGPIGSGKTHFSRAVIRALLGDGTEVPSPTFTLVQTYATEEPEIWHADLYRLSHPDEVIELGLEAAFSSAICLVEWPDRLGDLVPDGALHMAFATEGEGRRVTFTPPGHPLLEGLA